jgi:hypothetical protein
MKFFFTLATIGILFTVLLCSGCINTSPQTPLPTTQAPLPTTVPSPSITTPSPILSTPVPTPATAVYPDALPLGRYATFGNGSQTGEATVYSYEIRPNYTWTAPFFKSPREQSASSPPNEIERGYILEKPREGYTFLFVYVRVNNTGSSAVYAPSASQFVVYNKGSLYNYTSVRGSYVIIDTVSGTQYDYQIGRVGAVGYIQPGASNRAEGYLIYEVPAAIHPPDTYVVVNLDYRNQAVWRLG